MHVKGNVEIRKHIQKVGTPAGKPGQTLIKHGKA